MEYLCFTVLYMQKDQSFRKSEIHIRKQAQDFENEKTIQPIFGSEKMK